MPKKNLLFEAGDVVSTQLAPWAYRWDASFRPKIHPKGIYHRAPAERGAPAGQSSVLSSTLGRKLDEGHVKSRCICQENPQKSKALITENQTKLVYSMALKAYQHHLCVAFSLPSTKPTAPLRLHQGTFQALYNKHMSPPYSKTVRPFSPVSCLIRSRAANPR